MKNIFITFGGPSQNYHNSVDRICSQALSLNFFDEICGLKEDYLVKDTIFWNMHKDFILSNSRGFGYWLWKSYIIKKKLELMEENDILVYADAGCHLNAYGINRLYDYINIVNNDEFGILSFQLNLKEKEFTKMDVINHFNAANIKDTGMLIATTFIIRKCKHSVDLINKWYDSSCIYNLVNDSLSISPNDTMFKVHRHDQSIFSIIRKKYGTSILPDETYFLNWNDGINFPILALRDI